METLKVTILSKEEVGGLLRVKVESPYGIDDLGMNLDKKYLNFVTDVPKWEDEVKFLLKKKYNKEISWDGETTPKTQ